MFKDLHSEITSLDILLRVQIQAFGLKKTEKKSQKDEFAMLSENYLKYAE
ncbi:hypothetical protein [Fusobacterium sp.]